MIRQRLCTFALVCSLGRLFSGCAGTVPDTNTQFAQESLTQAQLLAVADVAVRKGDVVRGQQYLLAARAAGADDAYVLPRLLRLYVRDRQYRLAIEHAEDYVRIHPAEVPLSLVLASLYRAVGRDADADQLYRRILAVDPGHAEAHFNLGILLHDGGRELGRADDYLRRYLALAPAGAHAGEARALLLTEVP